MIWDDWVKKQQSGGMSSQGGSPIDRWISGEESLRSNSQGGDIYNIKGNRGEMIGHMSKSFDPSKMGQNIPDEAKELFKQRMAAGFPAIKKGAGLLAAGWFGSGGMGRAGERWEDRFTGGQERATGRADKWGEYETWARDKGFEKIGDFWGRQRERATGLAERYGKGKEIAGWVGDTFGKEGLEDIINKTQDALGKAEWELGWAGVQAQQALGKYMEPGSTMGEEDLARVKDWESKIDQMEDPSAYRGTYNEESGKWEGGILGDKFEKWDQYGPGGERYGQKEMDAMGNLALAGADSNFANELGTNLKDLRQKMEEPESVLGQEVTGVYEKAAQGLLTPADSDYIKNTERELDRQMGDEIEQIKKQAAVGRGLSTGRTQKLIADKTEEYRSKKAQMLGQIQKERFDQASDYLLQNRQLNNQLTSIAGDLAKQAGVSKLQANEQIMGHIIDAANTSIKQADMQFDQARLGLEAEMHRLKATMDETSWKYEYDRKVKDSYMTNMVNFMNSVVNGIGTIGGLGVDMMNAAGGGMGFGGQRNPNLGDWGIPELLGGIGPDFGTQSGGGQPDRMGYNKFHDVDAKRAWERNWAQVGREQKVRGRADSAKKKKAEKKWKYNWGAVSKQLKASK